METDRTDATTTDTRTDHNIWVGLSYDDPLAARAWLRELGFDEGILVQDEAGAVEHSEMLWPEGGRVMVSSRAKGHDTFVAGARSATVYVVVDDPDAVWQRAQGLGAALDRPMEETDYGSRGFSVRDAEGNSWSFGTYAG
jgi:uncharacterized glyoxalase superfamily protein PhnB